MGADKVGLGVPWAARDFVVAVVEVPLNVGYAHAGLGAGHKGKVENIGGFGSHVVLARRLEEAGVAAFVLT